MYMEDLDLCYRAAAGRLGHLVRAVGVGDPREGRHERAPPDVSRVNRAFHYGMYRFYRSHYAPSHGRAANLAIYAGIAAKFGLSALRSAAARTWQKGRLAPVPRRSTTRRQAL